MTLIIYGIPIMYVPRIVVIMYKIKKLYHYTYIR